MAYPASKLVELEDDGVIELGRGQVISKINIKNNPGDFPIYSAAQMKDGEFGRWSRYNFDEELITWSVDGGGQFFYRPKHKFSVTNVCGWMRILKPEVLDYKYLFWTLRQQHDNLLFDYVNKAHPSVIRPLYTISLPTVGEQRRIVAKIEKQFAKIDEAARLRAESEALAAQLLPAALHEIFSSAESKGWGEVHIGDKKVMHMTSGGTPSRSNSKYYSGKIAWLKSGELNDNTQIEDSEEYISDEALKKTSAKIFPAGTVLIAMYGATAGKLGILAASAATNQAVAALTPDLKQLDSKYLFYCLQNTRERIIQQAWGGAQPNLSQTILKEFKIPLPPLAEQKKIVKKLDALSEKACALRDLQSQQAADLKALKQSILHEAFS